MPYLTMPGFIAEDVRALESRCEVRLADCGSAVGVARAIAALFHADVLVCWFGSLRFLPLALAARLLDRPIAIIGGGYDVASLPEIGYGSMAKPLSRILGRWLFALARYVVPFSESAAVEANRNARVPTAKIRVIPLGFREPAPGPPDKVAQVLTVANIDDSTILRKGLLTVARLSRLMPEVRFVLAGAGTDAAILKIRELGGPNLQLVGWVPEIRLQELYAASRVYLQPSLHEGFGSAVAEAMLHDCIPVVSRCFSLPEVVGDSGLYAAPGDVTGFMECIRAALDGGFRPAESPRARILRFFPKAGRDRLLSALVEELLSVSHG